MRKNAGFAVAATIMGLAMILWARSTVVATDAEVIRPKAAVSPYVIMTHPYLPIQRYEEVY
jgi:hypothetical protein